MSFPSIPTKIENFFIRYQKDAPYTIFSWTDNEWHETKGISTATTIDGLLANFRRHFSTDDVSLILYMNFTHIVEGDDEIVYRYAFKIDTTDWTAHPYALVGSCMSLFPRVIVSADGSSKDLLRKIKEQSRAEFITTLKPDQNPDDYTSYAQRCISVTVPEEAPPSFGTHAETSSEDEGNFFGLFD